MQMTRDWGPMRLPLCLEDRRAVKDRLLPLHLLKIASRKENRKRRAIPRCRDRRSLRSLLLLISPPEFMRTYFTTSTNVPFALANWVGDRVSGPVGFAGRFSISAV